MGAALTDRCSRRTVGAYWGTNQSRTAAASATTSTTTSATRRLVPAGAELSSPGPNSLRGGRGSARRSVPVRDSLAGAAAPARRSGCARSSNQRSRASLLSSIHCGSSVVPGALSTGSSSARSGVSAIVAHSTPSTLTSSFGATRPNARCRSSNPRGYGPLVSPPRRRR